MEVPQQLTRDGILGGCCGVLDVKRQFNKEMQEAFTRCGASCRTLFCKPHFNQWDLYLDDSERNVVIEAFKEAGVGAVDELVLDATFENVKRGFRTTKTTAAEEAKMKLATLAAKKTAAAGKEAYNNRLITEQVQKSGESFFNVSKSNI